MIAGQTADDYYDRATWQYIGPKWEERTQSYIDKASAMAPAFAPAGARRIRSTESAPG